MSPEAGEAGEDLGWDGCEKIILQGELSQVEAPSELDGDNLME